MSPGHQFQLFTGMGWNASWQTSGVPWSAVVILKQFPYPSTNRGSFNSFPPRSDSNIMNGSILKALGRIVVNFNSLEIHLSFFIWLLLGKENMNTGKIVTCEAPYKTKVGIFSSLFKLKFGKFGKGSKIAALIRRLNRAEEDRNKTLHSNWLSGQDSSIVTRYKISAKIKSGLRDEFEDVNEKDVNEIADSILTTVKEMAGLISDFIRISGKK